MINTGTVGIVRLIFKQHRVANYYGDDMLIFQREKKSLCIHVKRHQKEHSLLPDCKYP